MKVTILSGISGSGKSTFVAREYPVASVVSADHFFYDSAGVYRFDPSKLGEAHGACLRSFVADIQAGTTSIVVDNTNTTVAEIAPYAAVALAYGYDLEIVTILTDPTAAAARNTHGVPLAACNRMAQNLRDRQLPPYWPQRIINGGQ